MKEGKMSYLMLDLDRGFWKQVQHLAIDRNMNVKQLILYLLKSEIKKQKEEKRFILPRSEIMVL